MNQILDLKLQSDFKNLSEVESIVNQIVKKTTLNSDQANNLMLAFSEALTNAIMHGNKQDPDKKVHINAGADENELNVTIEDEGTGFDPDSIPSPLSPDNLMKQGGRGVYLMKVFCDDIRFSKGGRAITLIYFTGTIKNIPEKKA